MTTENPIKNGVELAESLQENDGCCVNCGNAIVFGIDKKLGYYKECPECGQIEYLHRRFLRFDRQSRCWR